MQMHPYDIRVSDPLEVIGVDPSAGSLYTFNIPDKALYRINSITFDFDADATGANRFVRLQFMGIGADPLWFSQAPFAITASTGIKFSFGISSAPNSFSATDAIIALSLPDQLRLTDTMFIRINVIDIQATDQISNVAMHVDQWIDIARLA